MKIGPLELQLKQQKDGAWKYSVNNLKTGHEETHGCRPTEQQARASGLEDAFLIRQFR